MAISTEISYFGGFLAYDKIHRLPKQNGCIFSVRWCQQAIFTVPQPTLLHGYGNGGGKELHLLAQPQCLRQNWQ